MSSAQHNLASNDQTDRVRRSTASEINSRIDRQTDDNIQRFRNRSENEIRERIEELDREWDVERMLEVNASTLALSGLVLGLTVSRKWLLLPGIVLPFLLQHGIQGWCPPLSILRRQGVRTRGEIDREKFALLSELDSQTR